MLEKELTSILNNKLNSQNIIFGNEIKMAIGIPDIMALDGVNQDHVIIDDYFVIAIYNLIENNNVLSIDDLISMKPYSEKIIKRIIEDLVEKKIITLNKSNIQIKSRIKIQDLYENTSIEVKIRDWRNGLLQARRYFIFSNYSYLAIYESYIKNVDLELFDESGVGLISINEKSVTLIKKSRKSNVCDDFYKYISVSHLLKQAVEKKFQEETNRFHSIFI